MESCSFYSTFYVSLFSALNSKLSSGILASLNDQLGSLKHWYTWSRYLSLLKIQISTDVCMRVYRCILRHKHFYYLCCTSFCTSGCSIVLGHTTFSLSFQCSISLSSWEDLSIDRKWKDYYEAPDLGVVCLVIWRWCNCKSVIIIYHSKIYTQGLQLAEF